MTQVRTLAGLPISARLSHSRCWPWPDGPARSGRGLDRLTAQIPARRLRKALDALAYASLVFDICIAVVTSVRALGIGDFQSFLIPVNYALTAVVVLSAVVLIILLIERAFRRDKVPAPAPAL